MDRLFILCRAASVAKHVEIAESKFKFVSRNNHSWRFSWFTPITIWSLIILSLKVVSWHLVQIKLHFLLWFFKSTTKWSNVSCSSCKRVRNKYLAYVSLFLGLQYSSNFWITASYFGLPSVVYSSAVNVKVLNTYIVLGPANDSKVATFLHL